MTKEITHSANFLASSFLVSKRCLKPIYALTSYAALVLRYICDSMDLQFKKNKSHHTRLYHSQIAAHCFCSIDTVKRALALLIKKRLITKVKGKKCTFTLGQILIAWCCQHFSQDVVLIAPFARSSANSPISHSSNLSNKRANAPEDQKHTLRPDVTKQSNSAGLVPETPEEANRKFQENMAYLKTTVQ